MGDNWGASAPDEEIGVTISKVSGLALRSGERKKKGSFVPAGQGGDPPEKGEEGDPSLNPGESIGAERDPKEQFAHEKKGEDGVNLSPRKSLPDPEKEKKGSHSREGVVLSREKASATIRRGIKEGKGRQRQMVYREKKFPPPPKKNCLRRSGPMKQSVQHRRG